MNGEGRSRTPCLQSDGNLDPGTNFSAHDRRGTIAESIHPGNIQKKFIQEKRRERAVIGKMLKKKTGSALRREFELYRPQLQSVKECEAIDKKKGKATGLPGKKDFICAPGSSRPRAGEELS